MDTGKLLDRAGNAVPEDRIAEFAGKIGASLIRPVDTGYESARQIWNVLVQKHPGAVLKCRGTSDVVAAVNFARDTDAFDKDLGSFLLAKLVLSWQADAPAIRRRTGGSSVRRLPAWRAPGRGRPSHCSRAPARACSLRAAKRGQPSVPAAAS